MNIEERRARQKAREFISDYFVTHPCVDCGETDSVVLTFDHIGDDKRANVSDMVRNGLSVDAIRAEIAKCEVVCYNCHAIRTHERQGSHRWKRVNGNGG